ncbi:Molybdopterin biosynthesis MoaE [Mytilinidion resinicola]|uniref:Molybdopterin synthase catalytic subunit n=1 Tax=Mytilinidion resinicola TaxID=574789 RepID=A0A6A6Z804_9PEZI|nr:Molybdopterin biosynthesis MoaE [Mytilinidion resinicola]KAF2817241.1 Molybdopterin biosynthesis MoaE [Mytilinidion resinicola]
MSAPPSDPLPLTAPGITVSLTHSPLNPLTPLTFVKSPKAGAVVLFAGTTRDSFDARPVATLAYESYAPLALTTLLSIATALKAKHGLLGVAIVHRLGEVPVGEESILIAVSAPHRQAAWRAGEEALEETKRRAEIWKLERFVGGEGVWRANRDGVMGVKVEERKEERGA